MVSRQCVLVRRGGYQPPARGAQHTVSLRHPKGVLCRSEATWQSVLHSKNASAIAVAHWSKGIASF